MGQPDYALYLVTDRALMRAQSLVQAVEQALAGGCTMVQLREKEIASRDFYELAKGVKTVTDRYNVPLIINDRMDIALSVGAAGVHLGQGDLPAGVVRGLLGENMLLGVSVSTVEEAVRAQRRGADYLGVGAVYPTGTKTDAPRVPLEELRRIRKSVKLPIVAIGGIGAENAAVLAQTGIDGLAVVSAILAQPDIKRAAARLKALFQAGRSAISP